MYCNNKLSILHCMTEIREHTVKVTKSKITWIKESLHHIERERICPPCCLQVFLHHCHCKGKKHTEQYYIAIILFDPQFFIEFLINSVYLLASNFTSAWFCNCSRLYSKFIRNLICNEITQCFTLPTVPISKKKVVLPKSVLKS